MVGYTGCDEVVASESAPCCVVSACSSFAARSGERSNVSPTPPLETPAAAPATCPVGGDTRDASDCAGSAAAGSEADSVEVVAASALPRVRSSNAGWLRAQNVQNSSNGINPARSDTVSWSVVDGLLPTDNQMGTAASSQMNQKWAAAHHSGGDPAG